MIHKVKLNLKIFLLSYGNPNLSAGCRCLCCEHGYQNVKTTHRVAKKNHISILSGLNDFFRIKITLIFKLSFLQSYFISFQLPYHSKYSLEGWYFCFLDLNHSSKLKILYQYIIYNLQKYEAMESVMCDVIKIILKRRDEWGNGKGNP